jgi:hypothetical protein
MTTSMAEMTHDELMQHKLKLFHLHRDYKLLMTDATNPSVMKRLHMKLNAVSRQIDHVISELSRRNPAKNPTLQ